MKEENTESWKLTEHGKWLMGNKPTYELVEDLCEGLNVSNNEKQNLFYTLEYTRDLKRILLEKRLVRMAIVGS